MSYLIVSSVSFMLCFLFYLVVLKRLTFFQLNRVYLLFALLFSALLPYLSIPLRGIQSNVLPHIYLPAIDLISETQPALLSVMQVLVVVYWAGVMLGILWLTGPLWSVYRSGTGAVKVPGRYLLSEGGHAFSFFGRIQIGQKIEEDLRAMILRHEEIHRDQWHSADVLLYSLARVFMWFNPFIHWAANEVQVNHEFIADRATGGRFGTDYQFALLNQAFEVKVFPLTNTFYSKSIIKKRILMMNKSNSKRRSLVAYAMVAPLIAGCLWLGACNNQPGVPDSGQRHTTLDEVMKPAHGEVVKEAEQVDVIPEFPGGNDGLLRHFTEGFKYPDELKKNGVEGIAYIQFVVNEDGSISDAEAIKSTDERLEAHAIAFVEEMPDWNPGEIGGEPVKVKMVLPLQYTLR